MPRHSNFLDILCLSSGICADGKAWKRKIFPQQQRTLDSPFLLSLSNGYGPKKNQNLRKFSKHIHNWKASRILNLPVSLGMSSSCYPSIPSILLTMKNWVRITYSQTSAKFSLCSKCRNYLEAKPTLETSHSKAQPPTRTAEIVSKKSYRKLNVSRILEQQYFTLGASFWENPNPVF